MCENLQSFGQRLELKRSPDIERYSYRHYSLIPNINRVIIIATLLFILHDYCKNQVTRH